MRERFILQEDKARDWLRHAVAAYMTSVLGEEPSVVPPGPCPEGDLPEFDDNWCPGNPGNERDIREVVRCAVDADVIAKTDRVRFYGYDECWDLEFAYDKNGNGYFAVSLSLPLTLVTPAVETRKLIDCRLRGVDAALAILAEAVASANKALETLDEYVARAR